MLPVDGKPGTLAPPTLLPSGKPQAAWAQFSQVQSSQVHESQVHLSGQLSHVQAVSALPPAGMIGIAALMGISFTSNPASLPRSQPTVPTGAASQAIPR